MARQLLALTDGTGEGMVTGFSLGVALAAPIRSGASRTALVASFGMGGEGGEVGSSGRSLGADPMGWRCGVGWGRSGRIGVLTSKVGRTSRMGVFNGCF
jgi:hypothetical protein